MLQIIGNVDNSNLTSVNVNKENSSKYNRGKDKYKYLYVFFLIANIAFLFVNIYSTCYLFPHNESLSFDYSGVIVAIFSLIVTILIGWQILSIINLNNIKNDVLEKRIKIYTDSEEAKIELHGSLCDFYINQLNQNPSSSTKFRYVINHLYLIIALCNVEDYIRCHEHISCLTKRLEQFGTLQISKDQFELVLRLIRQISKYDNVDNGMIKILEYIKAE